MRIRVRPVASHYDPAVLEEIEGFLNSRVAREELDRAVGLLAELCSEVKS